MKKLKIKIRTLLMVLVIATLCSNFLITDISYAETPKKICNPDISDCPGNPSDYVNSEAVQAAQEAKIEKYKNNSEELSRVQEQLLEEIANTDETDKTKIQELEQKLNSVIAIQSKIEKIKAGEAPFDSAALKALEDEIEEIKAGGAAFDSDALESLEEEQAVTETTSSSDTLSDAKFNVRENLTLDNGEQTKKYFDKDNQYSPIVNFVLEIINFAITIMGSIAVILFIIAGFMFMFGMGNQQKVDEAKDVIKYAAIGMAVALLSYIIAIFVQSIFSAT